MCFNILKKSFLLILLGFFVYLFALAVSDKAIASVKPSFNRKAIVGVSEPPRAMWVWDVKIFQDEEATRRLLKFCEDKNVRTLFYTAYKVTGNVGRDYRRLNRLAHQRRISVHALAGDPRWAIEKYHHRFLEWVNDVLEFNTAAMPGERFDGIHSDVEPYLLGKMWEEDTKKLLLQYLDMSQKARVFIDKMDRHRTMLVADVPFWYDDDTQMWVEWNEKFAPCNYHILDIVDRIAIMDYRNFAEGENGSILLAKNEISYADKVGKKVYIGQETGENLQPEYITFAGRGIDYMEGEIKKLVKAYMGHPSFAGIAIHHYISYKRLLKKSGKVVE